jgi:hypothetical protein
MKHKIPFLCLLLAITSCKKTVEGPQGPQGTQGPAGPAGPSGSNAPGQLRGKVGQYDQYGNIHKTGLNTATVTLKGTSNFTVTDAAGMYTLTNIPEGSHQIEISRPQTRTMLKEQVHMISSGSIVYNFHTSDSARFTLSNGSVKDTTMFGNPVVLVRFKVTPDVKTRFAVALFGKTPNMVPHDASTFLGSHMMGIGPNTADFEDHIFVSTSAFNGNFESGEKVFVKIFPSASYYSTEYDYLHERDTYWGTGVPLPQTFTITIP